LHKKRISGKDYYYTTIRESSTKTKTLYLGSDLKKAKHKERELGLTHRNLLGFVIIYLAIIISFSVVLMGFSFTGFVTQEIDLSDSEESTVDSISEGDESDYVEEVVEEEIEEDTNEEESEEEVKISETVLEINETEEENVSIEINETEIIKPINITNETNIDDNISFDLNVTESNTSLDLNNTLENVTGVSLNVTNLNQTIVNQALGPEKNVTLRYYGVVINQPVRWEKKIELKKEVEELKINIPNEANNITITKIQKNKTGEKQRIVEIEDKEIEKTNLITGNVAIEFSFGDFFKNFFNNLFTGFVVFEKEKNEQIITINGPLKGAVVEYYMPGPTSEEIDLGEGRKEIIVSGNNFSNVLAYVYFNESPSGGVSLYQINEKSRDRVDFISKDLDKNGKIDYIEWIIPDLNGEKEFEIEITILNVQSYPYVGGNWTVLFNTTGIANLSIEPFNGTTWNIEEGDFDLQFLELKCGNKSVDYLWKNSSIFVENYDCNETGIESSKVFTDAKHYLKFEFGGQIAYAYNDILSCGDSISGNVVMENDITDCAANGLSIGASGTILDCDGHTIDGDGGSDDDFGIWNAYGRNNVIIKNCHITQFDRGAYGSGANVLWLNNTFDAIQDYGLKIQNSDNVSVLNTTFKDYAAIGLEYKGVIGGVIDNNICYNLTGSRCINFPSSGASDRNHEINITNNNLSTSAYGAFLYYGRDCLFKDNRVFDNTAMGVYMNYAGNLTIEGNKIYTTDASQDHGIYITGGETDNNTIINNIFENHTNQWPSTGIRVSTSDFSNNVIDNNTFIDNEAGIYFYPAGSWNNITNNYFDGINYQGIYFYGIGGAPNNRIIGNVVESNTGGSGDHDYYIRGSENVTMINNSANDCGSYCIYLYESGGAVIENFYGALSSSYTLYLYKSDNINLTNITIDTTSSGPYIYGPRNSHFTNMTINASGSYGILAYHNDHNTYRNVTSTSSSYGLRWYNASNNLHINSNFSGSTNDIYTDGGERDKNLTFLNVSFSSVNWVNSMAIFDRKWFLDVKTNLVTDSSPLANSVIQIYNNTGTSENDLVLNLTTGAEGNILRQNLTNHLMNRTAGNYSYKTNYTIVVNHSEYDGKSKEVNLTEDKSILFELGTVNTPPPAFSNIILNSSSNTNSTDENLTVYFDTNLDEEGSQVFNITDWRMNETSIALVNMPFDKEVTTNNGTIRDFSTYENNGTLGNDTSGNQPTWQNGTDCKIGGCYHFDGGVDFDYDNDFIQLYEDFNLTQGVTIMGWMKFDNLDSDHALVNLANTSKEELVIWMDEFVANDRFGIAVYDSGWHATYGTTVLDTTSWWHVAFVYHNNASDNYAQLYVNGTQEGSNLEYDIGDATDSSWRIGLGDSGGKAHNGSIDEFKIFNRSLSPEQIYNIYSEGFNNRSVQILVSNETNIVDNWTVALTPSDLDDYGTTTLSNGLVVLEVPSNNPITPIPLLNSTDGTNSLDVDLNCSATITGPNLEKMNVTVRWYRSNDYMSEENFTNSFPSGTLFNGSLDSGNTSEGDSWHCAMRLNDTLAGSEWGNSSEFTLKEFNNTYYVSKQGSDTNAGTSWKDAWNTINYAENTAGANAIIYVGDGLYREQSYVSSELLIVDKNVQNRTFVSFNKSQAIIQANKSDASIVVRFNTGANNVTFKGFVIDGNNTESGLWADQGTGTIRLYNNTFVNSTSYGIAMYDYGGSSGPRHNWHIEGNIFNNTVTGILGLDSSNVTIKNNNFTYKLSSTNIKYFGPSPNNTLIQGNYFENSSQACIEIHNIGANWQIKDNQFGNPNNYLHNYAIKFNNSQNLLIQNNTFWYGNFSLAWVSIYTSANNNNGLKIIGNKWGNASIFLNLSSGVSNGYAISVLNVSNSLFENNSFYINDGVGIGIRGNGNGLNKNMTIRNNLIDHNTSALSIPGGYSIYVGEDTVPNFEGEMNDTLIENNTIRMAQVPTNRHPLFTSKTFNTTVRYNTVIGGGYGILSKHETLYRAYNNTMENQTNFEGFVTRAGHNVSVYNNTFLCPNYNGVDSPIAIVAKNAKYSNPRNVTNFQVYNNRFYIHNHSYLYVFTENGTNFSNTNFSSWDNIIILNNSNQNIAWEDTISNRYNFTEFQKNFTLETDSIFSAEEEIPWVLNRTNISSYTTVVINWTSQESANASINYGNTVSLGTTYGNASLGLSHSINLSELSEGTIYHYNITMCDYDENCNETGTYNFTTITGNSAPNTPIVNITAIGGDTNYTTQNLNCSAIITDPESNKLNVSVKWYNNSVLWLSQDYNDSYASGTLFNATLNSSNTTKWDVWNCSIRLNDGAVFGGWGNSSNITILNIPPPAYTNILLNTTSSSNTNYTDENLTVYFDTGTDKDADGIYNITDWRLNGNSTAVLNSPFDSNISSLAFGAIKDYSTFGNNGTLRQWEALPEELVYPSWVNEGIKGGAYLFRPAENSKPYINFSHSDSLNITKEITVEIWINKSWDNDYQGIVVKGAGGTEASVGHRNSFLLRAWTNGDIQFRILGSAAADQPYSANTTGGVSLNEWHHVVGVYDRQNVSIYVDGVRFEGEKYTGNIRDSSIDVWVGQDMQYAARSFNGTLDELRIYNESLSTEQILSNYQAGLANHAPMRILSNDTVKINNWSVAITPNDLDDDGPTTISNPLLILNKPPEKVILDSPANLNITIDRTETSNWSISNDADGDSVTYMLELDDDDEFAEPVIINVSTATNEYTILNDLNLDITYWWRVRGNDSYDLGVWSDPYNFTVQSFLAVSLINESPNFGRLYTGDSDNTTDESPTPIVIQNDGNALINISINATSLFDAVAMDTSYYQFRIDNSSEETAFDWLTSFITWTNMATAQVIAIDSLKYQDTNDTAQCEMLVELPFDEPPGNKTSYVLFESSLTE